MNAYQGPLLREKISIAESVRIIQEFQELETSTK